MRKNFFSIEKLKNRINFKKLGIFFGAVLTLFVILSFVSPVLASSGSSNGNQIFDAILRVCTAMAISLATLCIKLSIFALEYIITIAGYNGYLDTPAVQVGWVMVRDVSNMFFVIILLVIAFGTILGLEQYEWKKMMVKFVLAAILINFSRTICGVIIDAAQVFMITFVNAVAATAGGNLMRMFKMDQIISFSRSIDAQDVSDTNVFLAAAGSLLFAAILLGVMVAYLIIMLMRMLVLWVLIILSPLAFVLSLLPQTQGQAQRWWKEFGNHVTVGPVVIFFVWLSFVAAGSGNLFETDVNAAGKTVAQMNTSVLSTEADAVGKPSSAGLSQILEWSSMANFFIAVGMLMVGVRVANELGVEGGSAMNKAVDYGKKIATIGTGVAAGMWMANKTKDLGVGAAKWTGGMLKKGALEGADLAFDARSKYEMVGNFIKRQQESYRSWRANTGLTKTEEYTDKNGEKKYRFTEDKNGDAYFKRNNQSKNRKERDAAIEDAVEKVQQNKDGKFELEGQTADTAEELKEKLKNNSVERADGGYEWGDYKLTVADSGFGRFMQQRAHSRRAALIASRKKLEKTTNFAKTREELLDKRTKGVPTGFWMLESETGVDALDRSEQGELKGEKARSEGKTGEFHAKGQKLIAGSKRMQEGKVQWDKETFSQQGAAHEIEKERTEAALAAGKANSRRGYAKGDFRKGKGEKAIKRKLELEVMKEEAESAFKGLTGEWHLDFEKGEDLLDELREGKRGKLLKERDDLFNQSSELEKENPKESERLLELSQEKEKQANLLKDGDPKAIKFLVEEEKERMREEKVVKEQEAKVLASEGKDEAAKKAKEEASGLAEEERLLRLGLLHEEAHAAAALAQKIENVLKSAEVAGANKASTKLVEQGMKKDVEALNILKKFSGEHSKTDEAQAVVKELEELKTAIKRYDGEILDLEREKTNEKDETKEAELSAQIEKKEGERDFAKKEQQIKEAELREKDRKDEKFQAAKKANEREANKIREESWSWQEVSAKAKEDESSRLLTTSHNKLRSSVEQQVIWDKRGIVTPTTAITELIEKYEKDFSLMNYEVTVSNMREALKLMQTKKIRGEDTEADRATLMGLFKHAFNESRVDDAIISVMGDESLKKTFADTFGWQDGDWEYTPEKINQVQMMFASGMDTNFGKIHKEVARLMDDYADGFSRDSGKFFESLSEGESGNYFKEEDKKIFEDLKTKTGQKSMRELMDYYFKVQEDNEGAMQLLGNLRDASINNNHPENAGHVQYMDVGNGKKMYVGVSYKNAQAYVNSDVNKMGAAKRAGMHTHASANIDESVGAVTEVREEDLSLMRKGINNANDYRSTNGRFISQMSGLSATDDAANFRNEEGYFVMDGVNKKTGKRSGATVAFRKKYAANYKGKSKEQQAKLDNQYLVENIFARHARANAADFLMTMANAAGIDPSDAARTGKMRISIPGFGQVNSYEEFRSLYNEGKFSADGSAPAPERQLRPYTPTDSGRGGDKREAQRREDEEVGDSGGI